MNWKLILALSLFGLAMAFATVYRDAPRTQLFVWLLIFLASAYLVAKNAGGRYFLHGFLVSIVNNIWVVWFHIQLAGIYIAHHPQEAAQFEKMHIESGANVPQVMILTGCVTLVLSGVVLGVFSVIASKILRSINS